MHLLRQLRPMSKPITLRPMRVSHGYALAPTALAFLLSGLGGRSIAVSTQVNYAWIALKQPDFGIS